VKAPGRVSAPRRCPAGWVARSAHRQEPASGGRPPPRFVEVVATRLGTRGASTQSVWPPLSYPRRSIAPAKLEGAMNMLAVPWALDANNRLVTPADVTSGEGLRCTDPACGSRLSLRKGQVRVHHFFHLDDGRCSYESVKHWAAKHMVARVVRDKVSGQGKGPAIYRRCLRCGKQTQEQLPDGVRDARVEASHGGLRPDVLLYDGGGNPLWAVEVLHTHAVTPEKAERLQIPWLELAADEVLREPLSWRPCKGGLRPLACCQRDEVANLQRAPARDPAPWPRAAVVRSIGRGVMLGSRPARAKFRF